jgi:hypothetical protein
LTILYLAGAKTPTIGAPGRGIYGVLFLDDVSMVPSPKLSFITNNDNLTSVGLAPGSSIHFGNLEFVTDHVGRLSLSPLGRDSDAIFIGMANNRSLS